ncbi:MAG: hypothetical protein KJO10_09320 [Gammaproteobacteria bacterium]|nr:hypothetical protein [Gammaproteobacteria bacterium]
MSVSTARRTTDFARIARRCVPGYDSSIHITTTHARVFSAEGITGYAGGTGSRRWPVTSVLVIDDKAVFPITVGLQSMSSCAD